VSRDANIRSAGVGDRVAVLGVVREAFATGGRDGQEEVDIVESVWSLGAAGRDLELVATIDETVVGYVLGSWGHLGHRRVIGVAPLGVTPAFQRIGVGSALMGALTARADAGGLPLLVLLGNPGYYQRFGFVAAGPLGIVYPPVGPASPHFQVRRRDLSTPAPEGEYTYAWERGRGR
jgi:putative acetyltransferase